MNRRGEKTELKGTGEAHRNTEMRSIRATIPARARECVLISLIGF